MNIDLTEIHDDEQLFALQQIAEIADVYKPDAKHRQHYLKYKSSK